MIFCENLVIIMRTGANIRTNSSYYKNLLQNSTSIPGNFTTASDSFQDGFGKYRTCDVIYEEPISEIGYDDNGNETVEQNETRCSFQTCTHFDNNSINSFENKRNIDQNTLVTAHSDFTNNDNENDDNSNGFKSSNLSSNSFSSSFTLNSSTFPYKLKTEGNEEKKNPIDSFSSDLIDIKSGNLVLIMSEDTRKFLSLNLDENLSRSVTQVRCPVIVKIHGKGFGKYAIVSNTKRRGAQQSFCVKLKNVCVTQSSSNHARFSVTVDGNEGKTYTFEASTPQLATEWMQAFSLNIPQPRFNYQGILVDDRQALRHKCGPKLSSHLTNFSQLPALSESFEENEEK